MHQDRTAKLCRKALPMGRPAQISEDSTWFMSSAILAFPERQLAVSILIVDIMMYTYLRCMDGYCCLAKQASFIA